MDYNHQQQASGHKPRLSMDAALQRSPLISVQPFMSDVVPVPDSAASGHALQPLSPDERSLARQTIASYDSSTAHQLEQQLSHLRALISSPSIRPFRFPAAPLPSATANGSPQPSTPIPPPRTPRLSSLATQLLHDADIRYSIGASSASPPRQKRPSQPQVHVPTRGTSGPIKSPAVDIKPVFSPSTHQISTPARHVSAPLASHGSPVKQETPSGSQSSVVVLPQSSQDLSAYKSYPEFDQLTLSQHEQDTRKREEMAKNARTAMQNVRPDQSERADEAVRHLQDTLATLFSAENDLEPDTSGRAPVHDQEIFTRASHGDELYVLASAALTRLDSAITKVISSKKLQAVESDYLLHAEKLCQKVIAQAAEMELSLPDDGSGDGILSWLPNVEAMDSAMLASRVILKIMAGRRGDRELCSEEMLTGLLSVFRPTVESAIIPIVELKATSEPGRTIKTNSDASSFIGALVQRAGRVLKFLGELLRHVDLSDTASTQVEDLCLKLIFVTNSASEKESVLGIQKFETFRRFAMDVIATIFLRRPEQRSSILTEILTSLEKLPVGRQSARQFKIEGRKPIQLVSALVMQLIQTASTPTQSKKRTSLVINGHTEGTDEEMESDENYDSDEEPSPRRGGKRPKASGLQSVCVGLTSSVQKNAGDICHFMVKRAMASSKSSDQPYRNLLDIFTEDFINVLGAVEWPAAEVLLRQLLLEMLQITNKATFGAPAKVMALDIMGIMGTGIADLRQPFEKSYRGIEDDNEKIAALLRGIIEAYFHGESVEEELKQLEGPYRIVVESLDYRGDDDLQLQQARNFILLQWAQQLLAKKNSVAQSAESDGSPIKKQDSEASGWVKKAIEDPRHIVDTSDDWGKISTSSSRAATILLTLNSAFCRAAPVIFQNLLQSMNSSHATVRSKALKSVYQFMDKDPSILTTSPRVASQIQSASLDNSTLVRDSALALMGKACELKPEIEEQYIDIIVNLSRDVAPGIRRRAVGLLKDIYKRNMTDKSRVEAVIGVLHCLSDDEEVVRSLAKDSLYEIWILPFVSAIDPAASIERKQELKHHAAQLITVADKSQSALNAFEPLFQGFLKPGAGELKNNRKVCKAIVASLFETFIENEEQTGSKSRLSILSFFAIFAQAGAHIFTFDQLKLLEPFLQNHKTHDDLRIFQKVAKIYNAALPAISTIQTDFVSAVQQKVISSIALIPDSFVDLMDEASKCLWICRTILNEDRKILAMFLQVTTNITKLKDSQEMAKLSRFVFMAGYFGKNWDFESRKPDIAKHFTAWKFSSVSNLLVQILSTLVSPKRPLGLQKAALNSLCLTCQTHPANYRSQDVQKLIKAVFQSDIEELEAVLLVGFRNFFVAEESKARISQDGDEPSGIENSAERLGKSMKTSDSDDATNMLAQTHLADVLRLAKSADLSVALTAAEIIASTNRQGLVVPRENIAVLICLETCADARIASIAYEEHKRINTKHESIIEKVYIQAFRDAFKYQRDVIGSPGGSTAKNEPKLKPFFSVLKESSINARKRFLSNIARQLRPPSKERTISELVEHYHFSQFVCENLGLAEYARVDELMIVVAALEASFNDFGNPLSQDIEALNDSLATGQPLPNHEGELRRLAVTAMLLTLLWRTRTLLRDTTTNLPLPVKKLNAQGKPSKAAPRDPSKPPNHAATRPTAVAAFLAQLVPPPHPSSSADAQLAHTRAFMDLHTLDHEKRMSGTESEADDNDDTAAEPGTPSADGDGDAEPAGPGSSHAERERKRKRSGSGSAASTPSKTRRRARPSLPHRTSSLGVPAFSLDGDGEFRG